MKKKFKNRRDWGGWWSEDSRTGNGYRNFVFDRSGKKRKTHYQSQFCVTVHLPF